MKKILFKLIISVVLVAIDINARAQTEIHLDTIYLESSSALSHSYRERRVVFRSINTEELKAALTQWWQIYATGLENVIAETDDQRAASMMREMRKNLIMHFDTLINETKRWQKVHSKSEIKQIADWSNQNFNKAELNSLLNNSDMFRRAGESKEFEQSFTSLKKAIVQAIRGTPQKRFI